VPVERELFDFFDKILGQNTGVLRIASRDKEEHFKTQLFYWPEEARGVIDRVNEYIADNKEVYFSPDLYVTEARKQLKFTKDLIKGSSVICLDFDGNAPQDDSWYGEHDLPLPSIKVQTSSVGNQHVYWKLDEFVEDIDKLENMRRTLTYTVKSDPSGWDAGQLLRVPYTTNHKYGKPDDETYDVFIEEDSSDRVYATGSFQTTDDFRPLVGSLIDKENLPSLNKVLADNTFIAGFMDLFEGVPDPNTRSDALMRVAYDAAESDVSNEEIYVLLEDADSRWGKYYRRKDRHLRYFDIIERAKAKYPHGAVEINITDEVDGGYQRIYDFDELLAADIHIEWFFNGLLSTLGYGILAGPPNVGKTQLAIRLSVACALQLDFLGWKNCSSRPMTVLFYSLEMADAQIKHFLETMTDLEEHRSELKRHFKIAPLAALLDFTNKKMMEQVQADIDAVHPDIIIIDSLSMAVSESLGTDDVARKFNTTVKAIRKNAKCAVVTVHHSKKSQVSKDMTGDMDDLYGSRFITAEADFVITFVPCLDKTTKEVEYIRAVNTKIRLGPWSPPVILHRTAQLNFTVDEDPDVALFGTGQGKHSIGDSPETIF
jgi:hypothetical protein